MRRLIAILAATFLAAGLAQATWYWSPPEDFQLGSTPVYTGTNEARCVTGYGDAMHVVYTKGDLLSNPPQARAYHAVSTDLGEHWSSPNALGKYGDIESYSPSIGLWTADTMFAVWKDSLHADVDFSGSQVYSADSKDGGYDWKNFHEVNLEHSWLCYNPTLSLDRATRDTVWAMYGIYQPAHDHEVSRRHGYLDPAAGVAWEANQPYIDHGAEILDCPSVWAFRDTAHIVYSTDTPGHTENDSVWYTWCSYSYAAEEHETPIDSGGNPSITFDSTHEVIAYEIFKGGQTCIKIARRQWPNGTWYLSDFTWPSGLGLVDSCKCPQLCEADYRGTNPQPQIFMSLTGFLQAGTKRAYVVSSTDGGASWSAPGLSRFPRHTDSCSVWATADPASILQHRVWAVAAVHTTGNSPQYGIRARVGSDLLVATQEGIQGQGTRQIVRQPGTDYLHRVHMVENFISYERSSDNGVTWDFQDAPDFGTHPSIALCGGNPTIVYLRGGDSVMAATLNSDSEWTIRTLFAGTSTSVPGVPSLAMFSNTTGRPGNVCFPLYDAGTGHSKIIYIQFDTTGASGVKQNTVDDYANSFADSACCVAAFSTDTAEVVYQHGGMVLMRRLCYSSTTSDPPPDTWPASSQVSTGTASGARHPFCEKIGSRLWVTYSQQYQDGGQDYWVIKEVSCNDGVSTVTWEGLTEKSGNNSYPTDFPTLSTSKVVAWGESSSTTNHWVVKADVADSLYLTLSNPDTNCRFVSILADTAVQTTPSTSTTGVYYMWLQQVAGETSAVQYASKQFLTSNADANVTMYNQGRKLALDNNDSLSCVFRTLQGSIQYARKADGVEGWNSSLLRNTGDMPAVTTDYLNRVYVADRDFQGTSPMYDVIRCQTRASGSCTWTDFQVYSSQLPGAGGSNHKIGPPSIVACLSDTGTGQSRTAAYIVYTVYEAAGTTSSSTTCMSKVSSTGVVYTETLFTAQGKTDSFPSIAAHPTAGQGYGLHVSYQSNGEIYVKKTTNQDQPQFTTKRTWSSGYNLSNTLFFWSRHPQIVADTDTVMVAWVEGDSGRVLVKGQAPGSTYSFWGDSVNVSKCQDTVCDYPSIALGDSIIVTYQKKLSSTNYDVIARVNFHSNLNITNSSTNSKYPHCLFHLHDGSPVISTVWTEELSTNYAEVGYKRWQLGEEGGGGTQSASVFDPSIRPCLFAPAPNPFAGTTTIRYQTNIQGRTSVVIHDVTGRRVCNLTTTYQRPGIYNVTWTGRDDRQRQLPEGIYFVRLQTPNYCEAKKLILTQ